MCWIYWQIEGCWPQNAVMCQWILQFHWAKKQKHFWTMQHLIESSLDAYCIWLSRDMISRLQSITSVNSWLLQHMFIYAHKILCYIKTNTGEWLFYVVYYDLCLNAFGDANGQHVLIFDVKWMVFVFILAIHWLVESQRSNKLWVVVAQNSNNAVLVWLFVSFDYNNFLQLLILQYIQLLIFFVIITLY